MNRTLSTTLRTTALVAAVTVAIALVFALVLLTIAQFFPDELGSGRIQWGDHSTPLAGAFSSGILGFLIACGAVTLAVLIGFAAIVFAILVTAIALGATAGVLALLAIVVGLPLILLVSLGWWIARRNKRHGAMVNAGSVTQG